QGRWGCYVVEVPGARALNPERHMYEEIMVVVEGRGTTEIWADDQKKAHSFEWQRGSMFAVPLNTWHRIVNAASSPALILVASTAPNVMNLFRDSDWIFNCPVTFPSRYDGSESYFKPKDDIVPDPLRGLAMRKTNLIPDIFNAELYLDNRRSPGYKRMEPNMASNVFYGFVGEHVTGRYSKAHAHLSSAVLVCIKGKGYTYTWRPAMAARIAWAVLAFAVVAHSSASTADDAKTFYAGKTLKIIVGLPAGGGADAYARLVQRHLSRHIPGAPAIIVQNMPGAGSLRSVAFIESGAPDDGTAMVTFSA